MYWPLDNYPDLLACDLLVKEMLLFKPNWWITQMKGSSVLLCQSKDTSPALKAKPVTVLSCELKKGNSLIGYWPRKVLGPFCSLECACVTEKNTLNSKLQNLGVDLRFSLGWRYYLEFSLRLIWTKIVCKCLWLPHFCCWFIMQKAYPAPEQANFYCSWLKQLGILRCVGYNGTVMFGACPESLPGILCYSCTNTFPLKELILAWSALRARSKWNPASSNK